MVDGCGDLRGISWCQRTRDQGTRNQQLGSRATRTCGGGGGDWSPVGTANPLEPACMCCDSSAIKGNEEGGRFLQKERGRPFVLLGGVLCSLAPSLQCICQSGVREASEHANEESVLFISLSLV